MIVVEVVDVVAQSIESTLRSRELVQSAGSPAQLRSCIGVGVDGVVVVAFVS